MWSECLKCELVMQRSACVWEAYYILQDSLIITIIHCKSTEIIKIIEFMEQYILISNWSKSFKRIVQKDIIIRQVGLQDPLLHREDICPFFFF